MKRKEKPQKKTIYMEISSKMYLIKLHVHSNKSKKIFQQKNYIKLYV